MNQSLKEQLNLLTSLTLLYVEDDFHTREEVEFFLQNRVKNLLVAKNGEEGLKLFNENVENIDIIISDVQMPIMNGIDMSKKIKEFKPSIPIVLVTAFNDTEYLFKAIELHVTKYLVKPLNLRELTENLASIAKNINLEKQNKEYENIIKQYKDIVDEYSLVSKVNLEGNITYINKPYEVLSGYSKDEIIGKSYNILKFPDEEDKYDEIWNTITSKKIWKGVLKKQFKDNQTYIFDTLIKPILDVNGNIIEYITLKNDITDLENSKNKFYQLSNNATHNFQEAIHLVSEYEKAIGFSNIILRFDLNKNIKYVSDNFFEQTGYEKDEIINKYYTVLTHSQSEIEQYEKRWEVLAKDKIHKEKIIQKTKNGEILHFNVITLPIKNIECETIEYMSIRQNITEILNLHEELENTQKDIIYKMGEVVESRSKETGNHVKRVAEYSKLLAKKYGLSKQECEIIFLSSPMHDIGKIGIEDAILNKPGKLTLEEKKIMQTHAQIGFDILNSSDRPMLKASAIISHTHHEKWDGSGYPKGLKGEDIHIFGRITAVADVFDALGSNRVYKNSWEMNNILEFFKEEKGKHFEPKLVDILFNNLDEFLEIRDKYKD